jgi:hypothetical protein
MFYLLILKHLKNVLGIVLVTNLLILFTLRAEHGKRVCMLFLYNPKE